MKETESSWYPQVTDQLEIRGVVRFRFACSIESLSCFSRDSEFQKKFKSGAGISIKIVAGRESLGESFLAFVKNMG